MLKFDCQETFYKIKEIASAIYVGYKNLILYKLGMFEEEDTVEYKEKLKVCNRSCPLYAKHIGVAFCSTSKEYEGERGCGCVLAAKLWSDSPCPLDKF